jgi:hypothetical protein
MLCDAAFPRISADQHCFRASATEYTLIEAENREPTIKPVPCIGGLETVRFICSDVVSQSRKGIAMSRHTCSRSAFSFCIAVIGAVLFAVPATAQKRVALVIGNAAYVHANALANPVNDAKDMAAALKDMNFQVILGLDLDKRDLDTKVHEFSQALTEAETGVFFYAGHGLQASGRNYLIPVDAKLQGERDIDFEAVGLDFILKQMELDREGKTSIVFLDACRDNPLARNLARSMGTRSASIGHGLAQVQAGVGTFVAYSTQPGNVALDGQGRNSPFVAALAKSVKEQGRSLTAVMIDVRKQVLAATGGKQVPWDHSALTGDFYFQSPSAAQQDPNSEMGAMQERLKQLEEQLKNKSDSRQTANMIKLEQVKEQVRQIGEAIRADQQRIFDTRLKYGAANTPNARSELNRELSGIQRQMGRHVLERKRLTDEIAKLETEAGLGAQAQDGVK